MIQYLVILLDETSVSFCHYGNTRTERRLMPIETLKAGILYGMKENLNIQFVYPDYALPEEYAKVIESIDHSKIKPAGMAGDADVAVIDGLAEAGGVTVSEGTAYVLRLTKEEMFAGRDAIASLLENADRLNIVLSKSIEDRQDCIVVRSESQLFDAIKHRAVGEVYVAGGASIYKLLLPYCESVLVTKVDADGGADTFFPDLDADGSFALESCGDDIVTNGFTIRMCVYRNLFPKQI